MTNPNDDLYAQLGLLGMNVEFFKQVGSSREQLSELLVKATELTRRYGNAHSISTSTCS
jgi:hypothetical protein